MEAAAVSWEYQQCDCQQMVKVSQVEIQTLGCLVQVIVLYWDWLERWGLVTLQTTFC